MKPIGDLKEFFSFESDEADATYLLFEEDEEFKRAKENQSLLKSLFVVSYQEEVNESEFREYTNVLVGGKIQSEYPDFEDVKIQDLSVVKETTHLYENSESLIWGKINLLFKLASGDGKTVERKPMWFVVNQIMVDYLKMPNIEGSEFTGISGVPQDDLSGTRTLQFAYFFNSEKQAKIIQSLTSDLQFSVFGRVCFFMILYTILVLLIAIQRLLSIS